MSSTVTFTVGDLIVAMQAVTMLLITWVRTEIARVNKRVDQLKKTNDLRE